LTTPTPLSYNRSVGIYEENRRDDVAELKDLLVDRAQLDQKLLAEVLVPFVGIDPRTAEIVPMEGWMKLSPDAKILVFLLARKAMAAMPEVEIAAEGAAPKEIERDAGVKGGTLRPKLVRLKKEGILAQDPEGRYFVPTHAVGRARNLIQEA
jgi:hypothetical protein